MCLCMPQEQEIYGFFFSFSKVFAENIYEIYFTGNEEWIEAETVTITCTCDYVVTWAAHLQTKQMYIPPKN